MSRLEMIINSQLRGGFLHPTTLRERLKEAGSSEDEIRNTVSRMLDLGKLKCDKHLFVSLST